MKKLLAIILAIAMALSATACAKTDSHEPGEDPGSATTHKNTEDNTPDPGEEPTEEERKQLQAYADSVTILNDWVSGEIESIYYYNEQTGQKESSSVEDLAYHPNEALKHHYQVIQNCTAVDKWAGTQWTSDPSINWDRQAVLACFTVLEDVLLYETWHSSDHLDNSLEKVANKRYFYNQLGQVTEVKTAHSRNAWEIFEPFESIEAWPTMDRCDINSTYEYDEEGRCTVMNAVFHDYNVRNKITATYDDDGKLASLTELDRDGNTVTAAYEYDQQRVVRILVEAAGKYQRTYSYEYDQDGKLVFEKMVYVEDKFPDNYHSTTRTYSYDGEGNRKSCEQIRQDCYNGTPTFEKKDVFTYECDHQGRPVKAAVITGDQMNLLTGEVVSLGEADYPKAEQVRIYGDCYIYNGK